MGPENRTTRPGQKTTESKKNRGDQRQEHMAREKDQDHGTNEYENRDRGGKNYYDVTEYEITRPGDRSTGPKKRTAGESTGL